ncbi:MAG TPA: hypothetical protein VIU34_08335 [Steroidobacter sp.]
MRALLLISMLMLAACGLRQPPYPPKSATEIDQLIGIAEKAIDVAQKANAGAPAADVEAATREMLTALGEAGAQADAILGQVANVDHLAPGTKDPMQVSACTSLHRHEIVDIENMSPNALMLWSMNVGHCAASAIISFKSAPVADSSTLALGLHVIDPIMLVAYTRSGLKKGALAHYLDSNKSIIAKLGPECEQTGKTTGDVSYRCAAYRVAMAVRPKLQQFAH